MTALKHSWGKTFHANHPDHNITMHMKTSQSSSAYFSCSIISTGQPYKRLPSVSGNIHALLHTVFQRIVLPMPTPKYSVRISRVGCSILIRFRNTKWSGSVLLYTVFISTDSILLQNASQRPPDTTGLSCWKSAAIATKGLWGCSLIEEKWQPHLKLSQQLYQDDQCLRFR